MIESTSYGHLAVLAVLILGAAAVVWAIVRVVRHPSLPRGSKVVWVLVLLWLPGLGLALWLGRWGWMRRRENPQR